MTFKVNDKRETVGKIATDLISKAPETLDAREQGQEMTGTYLSELFKTLQDGKDNVKGDFFIVVLTKRERALLNVIRNYFFYRHTCPTPDYDQAVYHYTKADDELNLLWVIPARQMTFNLKENALNVDPELKELLGYVLDFADGTLAKKAMLLNNEDELEGRVVLKEIHGN